MLSHYVIGQPFESVYILTILPLLSQISSQVNLMVNLFKNPSIMPLGIFLVSTEKYIALVFSYFST